MPLRITDGCINCAVCVPVCPNQGISECDGVFVIDEDACSECVGFFRQPQCAKVCPMDSCVPNGIAMTEEALFARALVVHADSDIQPTLTAATSHFQKAVTKKRKPAARGWWTRLFGTPAVDG